MSLALLLRMRAMKSNVVLLSRNASSNTASIPPLLYSCVNIKRKLPLTFPDNTLHDDKNIGTGSSPLYKRVTRELFDILTLSALSLGCYGESGDFGHESVYNRSLNHGNINPSTLDQHIIYHVYLKAKNMNPI